ncbi:N-alpha-acetyltransferase 60 [Bulinus truncatus]|nr:N-alpha-acetyltransferase 60 [Bulinus truncatus]
MSCGADITEQMPLSLSVQQEVQLRFLGPTDVTEVKKLCREWFPIEYPDSWYEEITSNPRFYSLAATHHARIVGLIVAELKPQAKLNKEDGDLLASYYPPSAQVAYILSLGVVGDFRRNGIASLLLDSLLSYLTSKDRFDCKAVYLHVLSTNTVALRFYERRRFTDYLTHCSTIVTKLQPCAFPRQVYTAVRNIIQRLLSRSVTESVHIV